jgi:hypothetical protein
MSYDHVPTPITARYAETDGQRSLTLLRSDADDPMNWSLILFGEIDDPEKAAKTLFADGWLERFERFPQAYMSPLDGSMMAGGTISDGPVTGTLIRRYPQGSGYMPTEIEDLAEQVLVDIDLNEINYLVLDPS